MNATWSKGGYNAGRARVQKGGGATFRVFENIDRPGKRWSATVQLIVNDLVIMNATEVFSSRAKRDAYVAAAAADGATSPWRMSAKVAK